MNGIQRATLLVNCLPKEEAEQLLERLPRRRASVIQNRCHLRGLEASDCAWDVVSEFLQELTGDHNGSRRQLRSSDATPARNLPVAHDDAATGAGDVDDPLAQLAHWLPSDWAGRLKCELDQTAALVLRHLPPSRAADILIHFSEIRQVNIVERMMELDLTPVVPLVLAEVVDALARDEPAHGARDEERLESNGARYVASMLKCASAETKRRLASDLRERRATPAN